MKVRFEQDITTDEEVEVIVKANRFSNDIKSVMEYIEQFDQQSHRILPVKTNDSIRIVKVDDIILIDVQKNTLSIETLTDKYVMQERLYKFIQKLPKDTFVQVSKHAVINIDYLMSLEDSFAGSMTAKLDKKLRTSVSRRYLSNLEEHLGL